MAINKDGGVGTGKRKHCVGDVRCEKGCVVHAWFSEPRAMARKFSREYLGDIAKRVDPGSVGRCHTSRPRQANDARTDGVACRRPLCERKIRVFRYGMCALVIRNSGKNVATISHFSTSHNKRVHSRQCQLLCPSYVEKGMRNIEAGAVAIKSNHRQRT